MLENSETKLLSVGLNHLNLRIGFTAYLSKWLSERNKFSLSSLIVEFPVFALFTHEKQLCVGNFFKKAVSLLAQDTLVSLLHCIVSLALHINLLCSAVCHCLYFFLFS